MNTPHTPHLHPSTATLVLHPVLKKIQPSALRPPESRLEEAKGLARAIHLDITGSFLVPLQAIRPATYLGKGKVEELAEYIRQSHITLVVMNTSLWGLLC